jgi:hypothetical protein
VLLGRKGAPATEKLARDKAMIGAICARTANHRRVFPRRLAGRDPPGPHAKRLGAVASASLRSPWAEYIWPIYVRFPHPTEPFRLRSWNGSLGSKRGHHQLGYPNITSLTARSDGHGEVAGA